MLILRVLGLLAAIGIAASLVSWIFTRDRRYLVFAWRLGQGALALALLLMVLLAAERLIVL